MTVARQSLPVAVLIGLVSCAGCQTPAVRERLAVRERNRQRTLDHFAYLESNRDKRIERVLELMEQRHLRDIERTEGNARAVEEAFNREFENWDEQFPVHQRRIEEEREGDMANIERTYPRVLF